MSLSEFGLVLGKGRCQILQKTTHSQCLEQDLGCLGNYKKNLGVLYRNLLFQ